MRVVTPVYSVDLFRWVNCHVFRIDHVGKGDPYDKKTTPAIPDVLEILKHFPLVWICQKICQSGSHSITWVGCYTLDMLCWCDWGGRVGWDGF